MFPLANCSEAESLALHPNRQKILDGISEKEALELLHDWRWWARPEQLLPGTLGARITRDDWVFWVVQAGRGFGKTRTGAETVREWAQNPKERILLIGPTAADVRDIMIEGPSGLLNCYPIDERPIYKPTRHLIRFPSGAVGITRSAEEPERLRGPQFTKFWWDELCAAQYAKEAWDQVMFGFRVKTKKLQGVITTTPKPIPTFKAIIASSRTVVTRGSSYANRRNISEQFYQEVIAPYEGTRLGRQEIEAELLEDVPGALWTRALIDAAKIRPEQVRWDMLVRIVVAVDPAVSHGEDADETGIVVVALTVSGHVLVLDDLTLRGSPLEWAKVVIAAFRSKRADRVIGEVNNGGDLVERNIKAVDPNIPFRAVRASRGKMVRAEPVAALYEQGRVHHVGSFPQLEDQMCSYTPESGERSPDRMDALVWGITEFIDPEEIEQTHQIGEPVVISPI
jgi:phage terminase large subunit-like protein